VTLAVTGNSIYGCAFRRYRVTVFQWRRLAVTRSRRNVRLVSYSGQTRTFCVFRVFSLAVILKCIDANGEGNIHFQSGILALQADSVSLASNVVDRNTIGFTVGEQW
jgi:hypothetical protein